MKLLTANPVQFRIKDISFRSVFQDMFPLEGPEFQEISESIRKNGPDPTKPVLLWLTAGGDHICIDGHRRIHLLKKNDYKKVSAYIFEFENEQEAEEYAEEQQALRRNYTDADIFHFVKHKENRNRQGDTSGKQGKERDRLARILHCSHRKIQECFKLLDKGSKKEIALVSKKSIYFAYTTMKERLDAECTPVHSNPEESPADPLPVEEPECTSVHSDSSEQQAGEYLNYIITVTIITPENKKIKKTWNVPEDKYPFVKRGVFNYLGTMAE